MKQLPTSVVRENRTLRSVGAGGGRLPLATRWVPGNWYPYRDRSGPKPRLRVKSVRHTRQFANARVRKFLQKIVRHLHKTAGDPAIFLFPLLLLSFEPRKDVPLRNFLGLAH